MKCDVKPCLVQLEKEELKKLCCEVKETVASKIIFPEIKIKNTSFGAADLWKMRQTMKTATRLGINKIKIRSLV
ncbi:MAG TPA: hypothetical protein VJ111_15615 [Chitinophagaceae bacterium]|nr:hypothetical protein [Chitinophagaceae bacterium]